MIGPGDGLLDGHPLVQLKNEERASQCNKESVQRGC